MVSPPRLADRGDDPRRGPDHRRAGLDETFVDALCEPAEGFTPGEVIAHVRTFAAHRRTLVVLALGSHGVGELGWGDPMVWVAQPA